MTFWRRIAEAETRLVLAKMVWNFDMSLAVTKARADWLDQKSYLGWVRKPLLVKVTSREQLWFGGEPINWDTAREPPEVPRRVRLG